MNKEAKEDFKKTKCLECGKDFWKITQTHLWKEHQMTMSDYKEKYPDALYEDKNITLSRQNNKRGKTYEEMYGVEKANELKNNLSAKTKQQMNDPEQIIIRKEKCGYEPTDEQKRNISEKKTIHGGSNYRQRALEYYGEECMRCGTNKNIVVHHKDGYNDYSNYGNHNLDNLLILCRSCHAKHHNEIKKGRFTGISLVEKGAIYMLRGLKEEFGLDIKDVNFKDTPKRIARAYYEIFEGINADEEIKKILSTSFPTTYDGMVVEHPIRCYSMCPHHFLPVIYDVSIAYIPKKGGLGLSKLPRLVELLAKAPKLQETFTQEIVDKLQETINPLGCMVVVKGDHLCMQMRGVKQPGCGTRTSAVTGVFKEQPARQEFLDLINRS